jgi:carboxyl-terminal processing protease
MINIFNNPKGKSLFMALAFLTLLAACKKDPKIVKPDPIPPGTTGTRTELTKDSIFLYAKETYFWNDALPTPAVFSARNFADFQNELDAIKAYKIVNGKQIDKYSFLDDGSLATELGGQAGDYGFSVRYNNGNLNDLRIKYVNGGSPAAKLNVKRGQQIVKIGTRTDLNGSSNATLEFLNGAIFGNNASITMTLKNLDGTIIDVTVTRGTYPLNPILFKKVYTVGSKKVGYLVYNSFTSNSTDSLTKAFGQFTDAGISEIIVDLRYNGGGSVSTAINLTNLIAPSSANGGVMFTTYWTKTMQDGLATILKNQKFYAKGNDGITRLYSYYDYGFKPTEADGNVEFFQKRGSASITRAYFIVTAGTASASELVINNLKPVMDVKLIGKKTYGKPVGFFSITIDDLDMYIPQFQTKNSLNAGEYFDGMIVDKDALDDMDKDFGDPTENLLANALSYSATGTFLVTQPNNRISSVGSVSQFEVDRVNAQLSAHEFKGMVLSKSKLKLKK